MVCLAVQQQRIARRHLLIWLSFLPHLFKFAIAVEGKERDKHMSEHAFVVLQVQSICIKNILIDSRSIGELIYLPKVFSSRITYDSVS